MQAQELNCAVRLDYGQLSGTDFVFFEDLREQIREYLNTTRWTEDRFLERERIDCSFQINVLEAPTMTRFRARVVVVGTRPVYGTQATTNTTQLSDGEWQFTYARGAPLLREPDRFDGLTSFLDFYAYMLLGYDYDSFSELGGTPHFERARRISELAQTAPGWADMASDRTRSSLVQQILDPRFEVLRRAYYQYHFGGLDRFLIDAELSRTNVLEVLTNMELLFEQFNRQYVMDVFFSTKAGELVGIFEDSSMSDQAYELLSTLDPSNLGVYERLLE